MAIACKTNALTKCLQIENARILFTVYTVSDRLSTQLFSYHGVMNSQTCSYKCEQNRCQSDLNWLYMTEENHAKLVRCRKQIKYLFMANICAQYGRFTDNNQALIQAL